MAATLSPGAPEEVGMSPLKLQRIPELAEEWIRTGVLRGLVLLGARRGRIVLHGAWGPMGPEPGAPPLPQNALFNTASVGKVVTATLLMLLVEEGRVGLNRPIVEYLPEFQGERKDAVLVRHLLTHTAGLRDEDVDKFAKEDAANVSIPPAPPGLHPLLNEYLVRRYRAALWKPPGEEMSYSPYSYELLGEIVRRASGEPLDRFAEHRLFHPLGMNDTSYCEVDLPQDRRAPLPQYILEATEAEREARRTERLYWGSGSTVTTALDLAVFAQMFLNRGSYGSVRILSPASVAAMTRNQIPGISAKFQDESFPEATWGFGWSVHGNKNSWCGGLYSPESCEHWGAGGAYLWIDPVHEVLGVYFSAAESHSTLTESFHRSYRCDIFTDTLTAAIDDL